MRRLLITGGAGFIGANFVHYWLAHHPADRVVVVDALTYAGNRMSLAPVVHHAGYRFVHADICNGDIIGELMREERIDCIVHFAAESHVDRSITGPDDFIRTNVLGTHTLLKTAVASWQARGSVHFHHVSTDEVFGSLGPLDPPFTETTAYSPNSPYSASKAAADHLVRAYHHTFGLPVTTTNCSNNYGAYQFPEKLIPLMLVNALDGKDLPVYGRGENVRDWLYVEDHCRAIQTVLDRGRIGETYNVGGGNQWRNLDVVNLLCRSLDRRFATDRTLAARFPNCPASKRVPVSELVRFVEDRAGHDWRYAMNDKKLRNELGFSPMCSFENGIERTVAWYLSNESWWRDIQSGAYRSQIG